MVWSSRYFDVAERNDYENDKLCLKVRLQHLKFSSDFTDFSRCKQFWIQVFLYDFALKRVTSRIWKSTLIDLKNINNVNCVTKIYEVSFNKPKYITSKTLFIYSYSICETTDMIFTFNGCTENNNDNISACEIQLGWASLNITEELCQKQPDFHNKSIQLYSGCWRPIVDFGKMGLEPSALVPEKKLCFESMKIVPQPGALATFDTEICDVVRTDLVQQRSSTGQYFSGSIRIVERRLKAFAHNGYTAIRPPVIVYLDRQSESEGRGPSGSRTSLVQGDDAVLVARNPVQLRLPQDPNCTVIFALEYTLAEVGSPEDKAVGGANRKASFRGFATPTYCFLKQQQPISTTETIRWCSCPVFSRPDLQNAEDSHQLLEFIMRGSEELAPGSAGEGDLSLPLSAERRLVLATCPDGSLCYRNALGCSVQLRLSFALSVDVRPQGDVPVSRAMSAPVRARVHYTSDQDLQGEKKRDLDHRPSSAEPRRARRKPRVSWSTSRLCPEKRRESQEMNEEKLFARMAAYTHQLLHGRQGGDHQPGTQHPADTSSLVGPFLTGHSPALYAPLYPAQAVAPLGISGEANGQWEVDRGSLLPVLGLLHTGVGLSRAAYSRLHEMGYQKVTNETGNPPEFLDPQVEADPVATFKLEKEASDKLLLNEIVLQFLAFSKLVLGDVIEDVPESGGLVCRSLHRCDNKHVAMTTETSVGTCRTNYPGYQIVLPVDANLLRPGEGETFYNYLLHNSLNVDIWDARSHLLIGTASVELKFLCRQGREAVQVAYALDVVKEGDVDREETGPSLRTVNVQSFQGRLHLTMANVGRRVKVRRPSTAVFNRKRCQHLVGEGSSGFRGGALSTITEPVKTQIMATNQNSSNSAQSRHQVRARQLTAVSAELKNLLKSEGYKVHKSGKERGGERGEKLARLQVALRGVDGFKNIIDLLSAPNTSSFKTGISDRLLELATIQRYRDQKKREYIERLLTGVTTVQHTIDTSFGSTEFFEFQLRNPRNVEDNVYITIDDESQSLSLVLDPREVRNLKKMVGSTTPTEDKLFSFDAKSLVGQASGREEIPPSGIASVSVFIRPNETVLIPMKYVDSVMMRENRMGEPVQHVARKNEGTIKSRPFAYEESTVQVNFRAESTGRLISQLTVLVRRHPAVIDQSFRFFHPELSYFKKLICLPGNPAAPHRLGRLGASRRGELWTRASEPNIFIDSCSPSGVQSSTDLLLKVSLGSAPQVREFLVAVYLEPLQLRPAYVWQWAVHALQRVDATVTLGQLSAPIGLLVSSDDLATAGGSGDRPIGIYASHPEQVLLVGAGERRGGRASRGVLQIMLTPRAVYELKVKVAPKRVGACTYQINVVDTALRRLLRSWILCVEVKPPEVTKTFDLELPLLDERSSGSGGPGCHKKITYTNPYSQAKKIVLQTNRPDLVEFKENILEAGAKGTVEIGLRFIPQLSNCTQTFYIFVNDEDNNNEETFAITAQYS